MSVSFDLEIAALFRLAPDAFVEARNALIQRIRASGDRTRAASVKALSRPTPVAWVVNQLYFEERARYQELPAAADRILDLAENGDASALMGAFLARKDVIRSTREWCEARLRAEGHVITPSLARDLSGTLESLAAPSLDDRPVPGQLGTALPPPGFDVMSALTLSLPKPVGELVAPVRARPSLTLVPPLAPDVGSQVAGASTALEAARLARERALTVARVSLAEAEGGLARATRNREAETEQLDALERAVMEANDELDRHRQAVAESEATTRALEGRLREKKRESKSADESWMAAGIAVERARRALSEIDAH